MKPLAAFVRSALWWLVPLFVLSAVVGYETGFGRALRKVPDAPAPIEPKPVTTSLLPEYAIAGGVDTRRETVERTLFTPTRRPAPPLVAEGAKPRMQRGQFTLTGTLMVDGKNTAFLRETNGGRARRVTQGESVNGILVAEVKADRVKLAMGDEVEELVLRVSTNPRPTPQPPVASAPAVPAAPVAAAAPAPAAPLPAGAATVPQAAPTEAAQTLAERRRAARAAQAAAMEGGSQAVAQPAVPLPAEGGATPAAVPPQQPIVPAPGAATQGTTTWNDVYQRYQYRTR